MSTAKTPAARGHKWALLLLSICGVLLFLFITEMGVRILFPELMEAKQCHQYHPQRYWTLKPDARATLHYRCPDGEIDRVTSIQVSSQGLRDRAYGEKGSDEFRVLLLGDSFIFGKGVSDADTIPKQMEQLLVADEAEKSVSIINAGVEGYGPWQSRDLFNEIGLGLAPDVVMLGVFLGNDVQDTMREHGLRAQALHADFEKRHYLLRNRHRWQYAFEHYVRRYWHTLEACTRFLGMPREGAIGALLTGQPFPPRDHPLYEAESTAHKSYMELELATWYPELKQGFTVMMQDIIALGEKCTAHDMDFFVFAIPPQEVVYDALWQHTMSLIPHPSVYERTRGVRQFRKAVHEHNIPYIPVAESLLEIEQDTMLYITYDGHLNEAGTQFVAEILLDALQKQSRYSLS